MEVHLTPHQEAFVLMRVHNGSFATTDDVVQAAVTLLEQSEERAGDSNVKPSSARKSLATLFAESPFRGLDLDFPRDPEALRDLAL